MTFLSPFFLWAALAAGAGVAGLHFLVTRPPSLTPFPTARFIPSGPVTITTLTDRPQDRRLLLCRLLLLALLGAAFARPVIGLEHRRLARVFVVDRSRAIRPGSEGADSLARLRRPGDAVVTFAATATRLGADDTLPAPTDAPGALGAGLVAAIRAGGELSAGADSVELVLVGPLAAEQWSEAVPAIRALWPGRIRWVPVAARRDSPAPTGGSVRGAPRDPLREAVSLMGPAAGGVRLVRRLSLAEDSAWVRAGGVLVEWPLDTPPDGWLPRPRPDTVGAVVAEQDVLVHPFLRRWQPNGMPAGTTVIARWVDGEPAATARTVGAGCHRQVDLPVPARGDLVLRPEFLRLFRRLIAPCPGGPIAALAADRQSLLLGTGRLATRAALRAGADPPTPLVPWLLGGAVLVALGELALRRHQRQPQGTEA